MHSFPMVKVLSPTLQINHKHPLINPRHQPQQRHPHETMHNPINNKIRCQQ